MNKTRGILCVFYDIKEEEISAMITKFRSKFPDDKRTDEELRPYAVNQIRRDRPKIRQY